MTQKCLWFRKCEHKLTWYWLKTWKQISRTWSSYRTYVLITSVNVSTWNTQMRITKILTFQNVYTISIYCFLERLFYISLSKESLRQANAINIPWDRRQCINTSQISFMYTMCFSFQTIDTKNSLCKSHYMLFVSEWKNIIHCII